MIFSLDVFSSSFTSGDEESSTFLELPLPSSTSFYEQKNKNKKYNYYSLILICTKYLLTLSAFISPLTSLADKVA